MWLNEFWFMPSRRDLRLPMDLYLGIISFTSICSSASGFLPCLRGHSCTHYKDTIEINGDPDKKIWTVPTGGKLLSTLASKKIFLLRPLPYGGGGTCAGSGQVGKLDEAEACLLLILEQLPF
ncbi:MAG: hypothetical protein CM15mP12_0580 [Gammaproteobacteria bacterium]|nr:MAG: hypothetical protein CM15mP12_0580 [Gammaproteobacteria bacterium]